MSTAETTKQEPIVLTTEKNGIRTITLNNPKKRNALSIAMIEALIADIRKNMDSEELRVIIIKAEENVFSSGHDLRELTSESGKGFHVKLFQRCTELMKLVQDVTVPVIAQVRGLATAAGCQLVASCDLAVVSESAQFATPGVNIGLFCSTPGVAIARAVPRKVAMEMLLTGTPITAQEALIHGLVNKVVPNDRLDAETMKIADRICETSRMVVALGKATFYSQVGLDRESAYRTAEQVMVSNLSLKDGQEGIKAFLEKRPPNWTHGPETVS
ncbi:enoyl-CoA hydratase domain-containing protein 3, mitochondrial-like isoform X2 [Tubulanus polymorphus]